MLSHYLNFQTIKGSQFEEAALWSHLSSSSPNTPITVGNKWRQTRANHKRKGRGTPTRTAGGDEHSLLETSGNLQPPVTSKHLGTGAWTSWICSPGCFFKLNCFIWFLEQWGEQWGRASTYNCCFGFFPNPFRKKPRRWLGEGVFERGESSGDVSSYLHGNGTFLVTMEPSSLSCWVAGASRARAHEGIQLTKTIASGFPRKWGNNYKWLPEYMVYVTKTPSGTIAANSHFALGWNVLSCHEPDGDSSAAQECPTEWAPLHLTSHATVCSLQPLLPCWSLFGKWKGRRKGWDVQSVFLRLTESLWPSLQKSGIQDDEKEKALRENWLASDQDQTPWHRENVQDLMLGVPIWTTWLQ